MGASQDWLVGKEGAHHTCEQEAADGLQLSHWPYVEKGRSSSKPDSPWFLGGGQASHLSMSHHRLPGGLVKNSLIQGESREFWGWLI